MRSKKLALRLDDLRIESFDTTDAAGFLPRGTVRGHQEEGFDLPQGSPSGPSCLANTCGCPTWADNSCNPPTYCIG